MASTGTCAEAMPGARASSSADGGLISCASRVPTVADSTSTRDNTTAISRNPKRSTTAARSCRASADVTLRASESTSCCSATNSTAAGMNSGFSSHTAVQEEHGLFANRLRHHQCSAKRPRHQSNARQARSSVSSAKRTASAVAGTGPCAGRTAPRARVSNAATVVCLQRFKAAKSGVVRKLSRREQSRSARTHRMADRGKLAGCKSPNASARSNCVRTARASGS